MINLVWDEPIDDEDLDKKAYEYGDIRYYKKGTNIIHRTKGPATIWSSGSKFWLQNNKFHRLDGPAWESDGSKSWYFKGEYIECSSQKKFEQLIKLKAFW